MIICVCDWCSTPFKGRAESKFCSHSCAASSNANLNKVPEKERFWSNVNKTDTCWLWLGHLQNDYGYFNSDKGTVLAHRFSWELHNGPIPVGKLVLHNCPNGDRRDCVNPKHLKVGTQKENMQDRLRRGKALLGEEAPRSKLTNSDVLTIRSSYPRKTYAELAELYGVGPTTIRSIVKKESWRHVS